MACSELGKPLPLPDELDHVSIKERQRRFREDHLLTFNGSKVVDCDAA